MLCILQVPAETALPGLALILGFGPRQKGPAVDLKLQAGRQFFEPAQPDVGVGSGVIEPNGDRGSGHVGYLLSVISFMGRRSDSTPWVQLRLRSLARCNTLTRASIDSTPVLVLRGLGWYEATIMGRDGPNR